MSLKQNLKKLITSCYITINTFSIQFKSFTFENFFKLINLVCSLLFLPLVPWLQQQHQPGCQHRAAALPLPQNQISLPLHSFCLQLEQPHLGIEADVER